MSRDHELTTADLAYPREEARGRSDEPIVARENPAVTVNAPTRVDAGGAAASEAARTRSERGGTTASPDARNATDPPAALFAADEATGFHDRWMDVQAAFVDEPRAAVERADSLVAEVMKRLAEGFASEREALERQWDRGDHVTTEDLRLALRRYRQFFDRLLKA